MRDIVLASSSHPTKLADGLPGSQPLAAAAEGFSKFLDLLGLRSDGSSRYYGQSKCVCRISV